LTTIVLHCEQRPDASLPETKTPVAGPPKGEPAKKETAGPPEGEPAESVGQGPTYQVPK
jgi:hypothetical protein